MTTEQIVLILKALDPGLRIAYSEYTRQWYVDAAIEIGDGSVLTGGSEHRDNVADAVQEYFDRLTTLGSGALRRVELLRPAARVALERCGLRRDDATRGATASKCNVMTPLTGGSGVLAEARIQHKRSSAVNDLDDLTRRTL